MANLTPIEFADNLRIAIKEIEKDYMLEFQRSVNNLVAMIAERVRMRSETSTGGKFGTYSINKMNPYKLYDSATRLNKGLNELKALQKAGQRISYEEFRQLIGKKNKHKNFELTGQMWSGFGIKKKGKKSVTIGGRTPISEYRIEENTEREGISIIAPSEQEIEKLENRMARFIIKKLENANVI